MINKKRALDTFVEMSAISSPTFNEGKMFNYLKKLFTELGYNTIEDVKSKERMEEATVGNLIVKIPGKGKLSNTDTIIFCSHMDTVTPAENIKPSITDDGKYVTSDGTTVLGADDKGGVAQIIEMVRVLKEKNIDHRPLELVFTYAEEGGCFGAHNIDETLLEGKKCYVIDGEGGPGYVIVGGPSYYDISAEIIGRSSHAGVAPEKGISAIQVLSKIITEIPLLKVDEETTANIGTVISEYPTNVVPAKIKMLMEVRSLNNKKADSLVELIKSKFKKYTDLYGAKYKLYINKSLNAYKYDLNSNILKEYKNMCDKHNLNFKPMTTIGGTDCTGFIRKNIDALAISNSGLKPHETDEKLDIQEFYSDIQQIIWLATE